MADTALNRTPTLRAVGLGKSYGGSRALDAVSFEVNAGSVHALVGENGAGKSTFVRIVTGVVQADEGELFLSGQPTRFATPKAARAAGVAAVYQDPKLFPHLNVAENIFLGSYPRTKSGSIDRPTMFRDATSALERLGVRLDPRALVAHLSVAEMQFIEIARALSARLQLLILDEPTAALTPVEVGRLFAIVRTLRDAGTASLLITHRLEEVAAVADWITVLRDGRHVATRPARELDRRTLVTMMVGRTLAEPGNSRLPPPRGTEALRVEKLSLASTFKEVSFRLHRGEIVGMAGLVGAGRSEIAQTIFGVNHPTAGQLWVGSTPVVPRSPRQMLRLGVAYLPEDRDGQGIVMPESVVHNVTLSILGRLARLGFLHRGRERALGAEAVKRYDVRTRSLDESIASLSGGNRQKVAFAKCLATRPSVLMLDEPTHGIDVATKAQVHDIIRTLAGEGLAVLLISSDLPEILALSDRVLVVREGRLVEEIGPGDLSAERIMWAAVREAAEP